MYEPTMIQKAVEQKKAKYEVKGIFVQQLTEFKKLSGSFNEMRAMARLAVFEQGSPDEKVKTGFITSFGKLKVAEPYFTHWSGKELDFIYLKDWYAQKDTKIVDWSIPLNGSYLYYSSATGRMPVIVDLVCKKEEAKKSR